jgi:HK97 family phage portal protein
MGAFNFWYSMIFNALREHSTAFIVRENGIPTQLIPFQSEYVTRSDNGDVFFSYKGNLIPDRDVFHLMMYTFDGINPTSPITYNAELMGYRMKVRKYASKVIGTGSTGFISSEGVSQEEGMQLAKDMANSISRGEIPFLGSTGKTTWNRQLITPEEGQYLETSKKGDRDIFAIFRYPNALAGDLENGTYSNTEQQDLVYTKYTLTPWARLIEDEVNRKLFTEANSVARYPFYSLYDLKGMLRGDIKARSEYIKTVKEILTTNELRELEGYAPREDGDSIMIQGANIPLDKAGESMGEPKKENEDE